MMKKIKKIIVFAMMMVMLVCSCMPVAAAENVVNDCKHNHLSIYDRIEVHRVYSHTHTEHNGTSTVTCTVYRVEYVVRYICDECGYIVFTTTEYDDLHIKLT